MTETPETPWFADHANLVTLANFAVAVHHFDAEELLCLIEKPWHYEDLWTECEAYHHARSAVAEDEVERYHARSAAAASRRLESGGTV